MFLTPPYEGEIIMKSLISIVVIAGGCALFSGCTTAPMPGDAYGVVAPQLVMGAVKLKNGQTIKRLGWDHPEYFGPVPRDKKAYGLRICKSVKARKAIGYHPRAKNVRGQVLKYGGYYCIR